MSKNTVSKGFFFRLCWIKTSCKLAIWSMVERRLRNPPCAISRGSINSVRQSNTQRSKSFLKFSVRLMGRLFSILVRSPFFGTSWIIEKCQVEGTTPTIQIVRKRQLRRPDTWLGQLRRSSFRRPESPGMIQRCQTYRDCSLGQKKSSVQPRKVNSKERP